MSAIRFYDGKAFQKWKGSAFIGTLRYRTLMRTTLTKDRVVLLETILFSVARTRDLQVDPDGWIYLITDGGNSCACGRRGDKAIFIRRRGRCRQLPQDPVPPFSTRSSDLVMARISP